MAELSRAAMYERGDDLTSVVPEVVLTDEVLDPDVIVKFVGHSCLSEFWCPYCGGWHGNGPPPRSETVPASPIPDVLKKVVALETTVEGRWEYGGKVAGRPAKVRQIGRSIEFLWGGSSDKHGNPEPDGSQHGHLVSHDGLNANVVREPGHERDTPVNDRWDDPYANYPMQNDDGSYEFH